MDDSPRRGGPPPAPAQGTVTHAGTDVSSPNASTSKHRFPGVWHDLRSVFAAATTNLEYLRMKAALPADMVAVVIEIENEVRLAAAVADLAGMERVAHRLGDFDLRALVWLAGRGGRRHVVVDATTAPFVVRCTYGDAERFIEALSLALDDGARVVLSTSDRHASIDGLEATSVDAIVELVGSSSFELTATRQGGSLHLAHKG